MATQYESITEPLASFISDQQVYFVATAASDGRVNVSPKGLDSLRILTPNRVVWLNGTGSGNETAAHVLDSHRMTLMFCAFDGQPLILRLYGTAQLIHQDDTQAWEELVQHFPPMLGARNIFDVQIDLVQTSCGFGVPLLDFREERTLMDQWAANKGAAGLETYQQERNRHSIDGFPTGLPTPQRTE
ncbi:pyridoxamine 5'-phosphate oxidase family protein [Janibacter limosus]|jgi:hypothetical protein|uniref:Pyridoxamine 5'-phosphate oxidase family protein n=1 Tax=Janibacter limosus TaxID=53458 RepID=A0A4P6MSR3_9MICO|nr:pyridoxamine 5'-phosphate oxidase family protein [Janibacter limosus]QBF46039.1 pyridoxamine 5'-phosphate oxidase family protein [Janibacter limosus]